MNLMEDRPIEILLRAVYDAEFPKPKDFIIVIEHRGAPEDKKEIDGSRVTKVQKDGFYYMNKFGEETFIPAHRMLEIKRKQI
jgi:uncharacterized protein (UPF0248 family)